MSNKAQQIDMLLGGLEYGGAPLAGGYVETFSAGTSTPKSVWTNRDKTTGATTTITLDSQGRSGNPFSTPYYADGLYKFKVYSASNVLLYTWDNLAFSLQDGPWVDVAEYASLTSAVASIGSTETDLLIDSTTICTANTSVPANIRLIVTPKGRINQGAYTLSISSFFDASPLTIFTGSGAVTFEAYSVREVCPEWWGAVPDGVTDCYSAIAKAVASISDNGVVFFGTGVYKTSDTITISDTAADTKSIVLKGMGPKNSVIFHTGAQATGCIKLSGSAVPSGGYSTSNNVGAHHIEGLGLGSRNGHALYQHFTNKNIHKDILFYSAGATSSYLQIEGSIEGKYYNLHDMGNDDIPNTISTMITNLGGRILPRYGIRLANGTYDALPGFIIEHWFFGCRFDGQYTRECLYAVADSAAANNIGQFWFVGCKLTGPTVVTGYGTVVINGISRGINFSDSWIEQQGGVVTVGNFIVHNTMGNSRISLDSRTEVTGFIDIGLYGGPAGTGIMEYSMSNCVGYDLRLNDAANTRITLTGNSFYGKSGASFTGLSNTRQYTVLGNTYSTSYLPIENEGVSGRIERRSTVLIENGTNASTIKVTLFSQWNGDALSVVDNIGLGVVSGSFELNADGSSLFVLNTGLTGDVVAGLAGSVYTNASATPLSVFVSKNVNAGGGLDFTFRHGTTGALQNLTTLVDTGSIGADALYLTTL